MGMIGGISVKLVVLWSTPGLLTMYVFHNSGAPQIENHLNKYITHLNRNFITPFHQTPSGFMRSIVSLFCCYS